MQNEHQMLATRNMIYRMLGKGEKSNVMLEKKFDIENCFSFLHKGDFRSDNVRILRWKQLRL